MLVGSAIAFVSTILDAGNSSMGIIDHQRLSATLGKHQTDIRT
jgi:hypothetical protein